jgi:hypothetical protein
MKITSALRVGTLGVFGASALAAAALLAANPRAHEQHGTIKSVDATAHTLVVADLKDKSEHKFQWNDQTRFTEHGKAADATELKAGEHIRFTYKGSGDMPTIEHATLLPAKAGKYSTEKS